MTTNSLLLKINISAEKMQLNDLTTRHFKSPLTPHDGFEKF